MILFIIFFIPLLLSPISLATDEIDIDCQEIKKQYELSHTDALEKIIYNWSLENPYYKNLSVRPSAFLKVPTIIHHIWLTSAQQKREISKPDIEAIVHARKIHYSKEWIHIVWTNDKNLIPKSVEILESNGIEVREISEIENHLVLKELVDIFIEKELWGMASDTLRIDIVNYLGGVYTDVDYKFARSIEPELYKYDFLATIHQSGGMENYFFLAKPNHPILTETLAMIAKGCNDDLIASLENKDLKTIAITDNITFEPFILAYFLEANKNNNVDAVYPLSIDPHRIEIEEVIDMSHNQKQKEIAKKCGVSENEINFFEQYLRFTKNFDNYNICGIEYFHIGNERDRAMCASTWAASSEKPMTSPHLKEAETQ